MTSLQGVSMSSNSVTATRLTSIDALRGTVILIMLLDHVRDTFYLHRQLADPVDLDQVEPGLFVSRVLAHLCAPVFVLLTGLSAWLYGSRQSDPREATSLFLFKRGLFLIVLEMTVVNIGWNFQVPPTVFYLQVIWAIGVSMLALSLLLWLPRAALAAVAVVIIAGHNLLDGITATDGTAFHVLWAILHDRSWFELGGIPVRSSYPVLPWIGIIALGYVLGPWFGRDTTPAQRRRRLVRAGWSMLAAFVALRVINVYGDAPWQHDADALTAVMSFFNLTKYPPSLLFVLFTVGIGLLLLRAYEAPGVARMLTPVIDFGAAPMFFYVLHLYVLKLMYLAAVAAFGTNHGRYYGMDSVGMLWLTAAMLVLVLYLPTRAFARLKARRRDLAWLRYF
ncbi:DUF1624 domain-containing protein [Xanthomonas melonis]|nr:DUF1624 domain-containing protein [Xanthomonas melonis]